MAQKPETVFRNKIRPKLEALPNTYVMSVQQIAIRGSLDMVLCVNGWFVALEIKTSSKSSKPDELQKYNINRIRRAGGTAFVVRPENWSEVYECIKSIADSKTKELGQDQVWAH